MRIKVFDERCKPEQHGDWCDHVRSQVIAQVREWVNEPHKFFVVDDLDRIVTDRINSKLDELAVEERLETDTDDPIREIVKLAGETFNGR